MKVEIWSDVVCPWCYIGKRRFETALAQFAHRDQVEVIWRSYQLDPQAPRNAGLPVNEVLARKYGMSLAQAAAANARVTALAAAEGLDYHLATATYANTFDAHRLIHFAAVQGRQDAMKERLMRAYFTENALVGDVETLVGLAVEIGLDANATRAVLQSDAYTEEVRADEQRARAFGVRGVPFFAIDETYGVSGAQAAEVFAEVLNQAWAESHPLITVGVPGAEGAFCEGDACAI